MSLNDTLANALEKITKFDGLGRSEVIIKPNSKMIMNVLRKQEKTVLLVILKILNFIAGKEFAQQKNN